MNVLVTGAFGNIGVSALEHLGKRGHRVRCFDLPSKANMKTAHRYNGQTEIMWGDLRNPADVARAVQDQDVVIHLAFIIPRLSGTGVSSEERPAWAQQINVGGTQNLLRALGTRPAPAKVVFASSLHVFGPTQDHQPPRSVSDPLQPVEYYAHHKVICEGLIRESGFEWAILRLAAALPIQLTLNAGMFDVPLDNRIEFVHTSDVGLALTNTLECQPVWGRTWLIGGGKKCQFYYREIVIRVLETLGVGMLPETAFSKTPYSTDWLDTAASQTYLKYQQHTFDDYLQQMTSVLGWRRLWLRLFRPLVRRGLLNQSVYFRNGNSEAGFKDPQVN